MNALLFLPSQPTRLFHLKPHFQLPLPHQMTAAGSPQAPLPPASAPLLHPHSQLPQEQSQHCAFQTHLCVRPRWLQQPAAYSQVCCDRSHPWSIQ